MKRLLMVALLLVFVLSFSGFANAGFWYAAGMKVQRVQVLSGGDSIRVGFTWTANNGNVVWRDFSATLTADQRKILLATVLTFKSNNEEVVAEIDGTGALTGLITM